MTDGEDRSAEAVPVDPDIPPAAWSVRARADVLAAIAVGGSLGALARYQVSRLLPVAPGAFPWATLWTNLTGSLALGFLLILVIERFPPSRYVRPFFGTGFLGAYTTFSTLVVEVDLLARDGRALAGLGYAAVSLVGGLGAVLAGMVAARRLPFPLRARRA